MSKITEKQRDFLRLKRRTSAPELVSGAGALPIRLACNGKSDARKKTLKSFFLLLFH